MPVAGEQEITQNIFGGLDQSMAAEDLPMDLSPMCSDVVFQPGAVMTRPSLVRAATLNTTAQIVYFHSYIRPDGSVVQLLFDSLGGIYADGVKIGQTAAGNRFYATNAFGRVYVAISDGLHGQDVPLQIDQNLNVDRVSQDGPGAPPTLANYSLPAQALVNGSSGTAVPISTATPIDPQSTQVGTGGGNSGNPYADRDYQPQQYQTYYTSLQITTTAPHMLLAGNIVTISGNSLYNGSYSVSQIDSATVFEVSTQQQYNTTGTGGSVAVQSPLLVRNNGQVTAYTAAAHNLRPGYRTVISGVADASIGISTVVVNNESLSGLVTVTTASAHGFVPGNYVSILNVTPANIGGGVASWSISNNEITFTTNQPHGLTVGDIFYESTQGLAVRSHAVDTVTSTTTFSAQTTGANASGTTNATLAFPFPIPSGTEVEIAAVPSVNSFQFNATVGDGTWNTGSVSFPWDGTFGVTSVPSATSFTYAQSGPNASVQSGSGTVTPQGQITPGLHKCWVIFQTRQGALTAPSPPVTINASGNSYLFVSNIPIGPSNVVARYLAFTGANGGKAFVLPVPPAVNGVAEGTSTVVNDNSTTTAIFDFSDAALLSGLGIDNPGNNLFNQQVMDSALGFMEYQGRLLTWGGRNVNQQFLNMGFEGGTTTANMPLGWTVNGAGTLVQSGDYGIAWQPTGTATISQPAYQDQYGVAILQPQTSYTFRAWVNGTVVARIISASLGQLAACSITANGVFAQAQFSSAMPVTIPADTVLQISGGTMDELSIFPTVNPYRLGVMASYINNPEAFDGVTGYLAPDDPHAVRGLYTKRDILSLLTEGPRGARYEVESTPSGEPASWTIRRLSGMCGAMSVWGQAQFEDWECWASDSGLRIDIGETEKLSQEVQAFFNSINPSYKHLTVVANDPYTRRMYILAPTTGATVANSTMVLDYRELNTAGALANAGTLRVSGSGKVLTTDLTRKWSPWTVTAHYCGLQTLSTGMAEMVFAGGDGLSLSSPLYSSTYMLTEGVFSGIDADYGSFWQNCLYSTSFYVDSETAQQNRVGLHRVQHGTIHVNADGVGTMFLQPAVNSLTNKKKTTRALALQTGATRDLEFASWQEGDRISYIVGCAPTLASQTAAPAGFRLSSMTVAMHTHCWSPIRGKNS